MTTASETQQDAAPGRFPKLLHTVRAEALAAMLSPDDMTGLESPFERSAAQLHTVMRALTRKYRLPIEHREYATNTPDGRVAWIAIYVLPPDTIASALTAGAREWIAQVKVARRQARHHVLGLVAQANSGSGED
jgi:hypothetical protein